MVSGSTIALQLNEMLQLQNEMKKVCDEACKKVTNLPVTISVSLHPLKAVLGQLIN